MGVHWEDGRLSAHVLFEALRTIGLDPHAHWFVNYYTDEKMKRRNMDGLKELVRVLKYFHKHRLYTVVAMGKKVHAELEKAGVSHKHIVHPAARGKIRARDVYRRHLKEVLLVNGGPQETVGNTTGQYPAGARSTRTRARTRTGRSEHRDA